MKKAYSYIRFSRLHQQRGDSLDRQKSATLDYCQRQGLALDDSLSLRDLGVSAFKGRNAEKGALSRFLEACENGIVEKGSALIVESLDRLSRQSPRKTVRLLSDLLDAGIEVHLTMAGKIFRPESEDGVDLIFAVALAMRAHEESETKSRRLISAFAKKRESAKEGKAFISKSLPWWLIFEGGLIVCPADRRAVVEEIFELTAGGMSSLKIASELKSRKVKTWKRTGWNPNRIRDLVRSNAPLGILEATQKTKSAGRDFQIPGYYPAIISEGLAAEARAALKNNNSFDRGRAPLGGRPCHLLRGIIRRKTDGEWMRFICQANGKDEGYNAYYESTAGPKFFVSGKQLEALLLTGLKELTPAALEPATVKTPRLVILQKQADGLALKISNIAKAVEAGSTTLAKRLVELEGEQSSTLAELEEEKLKEAGQKPDGGGLAVLKGFGLESLGDNAEREAIAGGIRRLVEKVFVGTPGEFDIRKFAKSGKQEDVRLIKDPTGPRGRKPLAMEIHFRGGARRMIVRGMEGIPEEFFLSARVG